MEESFMKSESVKDEGFSENMSCSERLKKVSESIQKIQEEVSENPLVLGKVENIRKAIQEIHKEVSELETLEADTFGIPERLYRSIVEANCPC